MAGTPGKSGFDDGPAGTATFTRVDNVVINSRGTIFLLDYNERLRKIEGGQVSTFNKNVRSGKRVDGPVASAAFALIGLGGNICLGENDDVLYLSDHWNFCLRRIDLRTTWSARSPACPSRPRRSRSCRMPRSGATTATATGRH